MAEQESPTTEDLGRVLVTGGAGFVGQNLVKTLLDKGYQVRALDIMPCPVEHPNLESFETNICDKEAVKKLCEDIDTVFHTAAVIEIRASKVVPEDRRKRVYDINLGGTKNILEACQANGVKRLVYTSSNSVILRGEPVRNGDETWPYVENFRELYTETKTQAEKLVLANNGNKGLLTCAIRPSGIWGPGDQTMFKEMILAMIRGSYKAVVGDGSVKLDNSYVHNLNHGHILAAQHLVEGGTAPGQAYFINDGDAVNMFEFSRPLVEGLGYQVPNMRVSYHFLHFILVIWQQLHITFGIREPMQPPLALERIGIDNYFSIEKAHKDLGYTPLYTSEQAMQACLPYYKELHDKLLLEEKGQVKQQMA